MINEYVFGSACRDMLNIWSYIC